MNPYVTGFELPEGVNTASDIRGTIICATEIMVVVMSVSRMTSIPVHSEVLQELQARKTGGKTWDDFLLELLEDYDPPEWLAELETRRKRGRWLPASDLDRIHEQLRSRGK